jgi:hypothetical protein
MYLAGFFGLFAVSVFFFFFPVELTDKRKAAALAILSFVWPVFVLAVIFHLVYSLSYDEPL